MEQILPWHVSSYVKTSDTVVFGIPRSASSSRTVSRWSLLIAAHARSSFSGVLLVAGLSKHGSLSTDSRPSSKHLCHTFICAALIALFLKTFWIIRIVSAEECSSLMQNLMQIRLLYSLSYVECDGHTAHMLTQPHLLPPLTLTVMLSLFTHMHSSPLSLAARLHWCHTNRSRYISNGWTASGQTSYIWPWLGSSVGWSVVPYTKMLWVWSLVRTHT